MFLLKKNLDSLIELIFVMQYFFGEMTESGVKMLRPIAIFLGLLLFVTGILGLFPDFKESGHLFGIFRVNFEHNILFIGIGILGFLCGLYSLNAVKVYFVAVGIAFAALTLVGFIQGESMLLGMIANNMADNWLHGGIATTSLYLGSIRL